MEAVVQSGDHGTTTGAGLPDRVVGAGATLTALPIPTLNETTNFGTVPLASLLAPAQRRPCAA